MGQKKSKFRSKVFFFLNLDLVVSAKFEALKNCGGGFTLSLSLRKVGFFKAQSWAHKRNWPSSPNAYKISVNWPSFSCPPKEFNWRPITQAYKNLHIWHNRKNLTNFASLNPNPALVFFHHFRILQYCQFHCCQVRKSVFCVLGKNYRRYQKSEYI